MIINNELQKIKLDDIVFRKDLYPRLEASPAKIQEYAEHIDRLPPIEIDQHNILIDGYHRLKAYETVKIDEIDCVITEVESEAQLEQLAVKRNAVYGQQLTQKEKSTYAVKWWDNLDKQDILDTLSISESTYNRWIKHKQDDKNKRIKEQIISMWMACYTQQEIADRARVDRKIVERRIADFGQNGQMTDLTIFSNFDPFIYTIWNIQKLTNKTKVFGSIPQEIIDNLLYYYTQPFSVVFDPFGGGGSTVDKCIERQRRYYVSDLSPIPARDDIRQWDIARGLPDDLPVPDFVFLDPPYWKQAEKKYSEKETDLGNVDLDTFKETIGNIARDIKRKWGSNRDNARLAIITSPFYRDGEYVDLPVLCHQAIGKYLTLCERIQVPYSTQIVGGDEVNKAKNDKRMIHTLRDLMVFKKG